MYAIVQIGGNQYRVEPKKTIQVDSLEAKEGEMVSYPALLFVDGDTVKVGKESVGIAVRFKVLKHLKGDKLDVYRYRSKSRFRRHIGFRPYLTELEVETIAAATESHKPTAKKKAA